MSDPRFTIHGPTVQGLPPTGRSPRKKLSHTVKATPSAPITGAFQPIATRVTVPGVIRRKGIRRILVLDDNR